jgi:hypothetical protein
MRYKSREMSLDRDVQKPENRNTMEMEGKSSFKGDRGGGRIARLRETHPV